MTQADFLAFYPQFTGFSPAVVMTEYIRMANARFGDFGDDMDEARRLYIAHRLSLYAFTYLPSSPQPSMSSIASASKAQMSSQISSKKVGDVQITYNSSSNSSSKSGTELADLQETEYGIQLLTLIRLHVRSRYVS